MLIKMMKSTKRMKPGVARALQLETLTATEAAELAVKDPLCATKIDWQRFGATSWADLLAKNPGMVDGFPKKLRGNAEVVLAAIKDPGDMRSVPGGAADTLLTAVLEKFPDTITLFDYKSFDGLYWKSILIRVPQLADVCEWSKLCNWELADVLVARPELAFHADMSILEGWNWVFVLRDRPELAKFCRWDALTKGDWKCLERDNPSLAKRYKGKKPNAPKEDGNWDFMGIGDAKIVSATDFFG